MCPKLLVDDPARLSVIAPHVETKRTPLANTRLIKDAPIVLWQGYELAKTVDGRRQTADE
ncbi:hypothetical protein NHJ6243_000642 [Beauveria neobassiana]